VFTLHRGTGPLLVSVPHAGRELPEALRARLVPRALDVEDTDWHVDELYSFVRELGASLIVPRFSRYVIDLNRPPDDVPMYPGANNTELCPTHFFSGEPLYRDGQAPDAAEIARRREEYWSPYHAALAAELARLHATHGYALLWDGHSIHSRLPWLFDGVLPDLNLGTAIGSSCATSLRDALQIALLAQKDFTHVTDGRFKGGYITRRYGNPAAGVHAVQLELCWRCYMHEEPPYVLDARRQARLQPVLQQLIDTLLQWRPYG
jgi:N-formylglutamate deformylase